MGKPKKRISPRIANQVNRDFERLILLSIVGAVRTANAPWECNLFRRPCWDPRIVAVCVFMKVSLCKTYDGIEAYLKANTLAAQRLGVEQLPGHSVIARGMPKMPMSYIRLISRLVTFQMRRRGMDVTVDSSGFSLKTSSKWFDIRIKRIPLESTARRWRTKGGSHSSISRQTLRLRRRDVRHGKYHSRHIQTIQTNGWTSIT